MNVTSEPILGAPGAGLPPVELKFARLLFRGKAWLTTRDGSSRLLARETDAIVALAKSMDEDTGRRRILVKRLPGMEDSSRYWSVFMTVEHVRIVNLAVAATIGEQGKGRVPDRTASTAAVKPSPEVGSDSIAGLILSSKLIERQVRQMTNLNAGPTYMHPWFGPLRAGQWYFLAGFHATLHRKQIESILRGLGKTVG